MLFRSVVNFVKSMASGRKAEQNPWGIGTLDWTVPTPVPHHNFDVIPTVVRGPHEFGNPEVKEALGRDWISQTEAMPAQRAKATGTATA